MNPFTGFSIRLTLPIFLLILGLLVEGLTLQYNLNHADVEEENKRLAQVTQEMTELQESINYRLRIGDPEGAQLVISGKGSNTDIPIALLVDDAGIIIGSTSLKMIGSPIHEALPDLESELMREVSSTLSGRISLTDDRMLIMATYPIILGARAGEIRPHRVGILHLRYDLTSAKALQRSDHERQALVMAGIYAGGLLLLGIFLHLFLTRRVGLLVWATRRFTAGDLSARTGLHGEDEIARIAVEFDRMAEEIGKGQEALRQAVAYNRSLIEASLDPLVTIGPDGRITDVNSATESVTGRTRSELIGTDFTEYFSRPEQAREGYQRVFREGYVRDYPLEIRHRDGGSTPVLYNATLYRDEAGRVAGVFAAARDITEQKRAEETIQQLAAIVESSEDAIIGKTVDGIITSWNAGAERLYGYTPQEAIGRSITILVSADRANDVLSILNRIKDGEHIDHYETVRIRKDGRPIDVALSVSAVKDVNGRVIGASTIARDITDRKRAEAELHRTAAVLEKVFSSIHILLAYLDRDFNFFKVNRAYAAADRHEPEYYVGKNHFALFPNAENEAIFRSVVRSGESVYYREKPFEYAEHPEWGVSYWDWALHPVKGVDGRVEGLVFSLLNVTETVLARRRIEEAAAYARSLIESSLDPLVTIGPDGKITDVNAATEAATGRRRQELIGTDFSDYFSDPEKAREGYRQVFREGFVRDYPLEIRHGDGPLTPVLYNASLYRDEKGRVVGIFAAARDVTELKRAQERIGAQYALLAAIMNSPNDMFIFSLDKNYTYTSFNERHRHEMQMVWKVDIQIGMNFLDCMTKPELREMAKQSMDRALRGDIFTEIQHQTEPDIYYEFSWNPVIQNGDIVGITSFIRDITERKRTEAQILKLNRIYAILSNVNQAIVRIHDKDELLRDACRIAIEYGGFLMAWIGMVNAQTNRVEVMAAYGVSGDYLERINIDLSDERRSCGPTGTAVKSGKHKISNNIINDETMTPWRDDAVKYGYKSSAAFPITVSGKVVGAFNIYSHETDFFHDDDVKLFDEMAKDISFALEFMENEAERKKAEEELRRSEAMLKKAQQIGHIGCWDLNLITNRLTWSDEIYEIFGIDPKLFGATYEAFVETIHPDDRVMVNTAYTNSVQYDSPYDIIHRIVRNSDGAIRYVNEKCENLKDSEGKVYHSLGTVQDITEKFLAAQELENLRHYLDNIINSMPSILVGIDPEGIVTHWNNEAARVSDIPSQQAKGMPFEKLMSPFPIDTATIKEAIHAKTSRLIRAMQVMIHGERRYCDVMVYPLVANFVRGAVIRIDDVTERVRIEEMMLQTEKMMSVGGLAAGMAHEINNPLSGIMQSQQNIIRRLGPELSANVEAAKETGVDLNSVKAYLEKRGIFDFLEAIHSSADRAAVIVKNMLQFSRPQTGERIPTDISDLVERTISLISIDYDLKKKYDFRNIEIQREYAPDLPQVKCIPGEIQQVIINILRNAAYAIFHASDKPAKAVIVVRLSRSDDHLRVEIRDNGPGMEETTRRRVFEPFFTTKPTGEGTGLGLSVSYYIIVDEHGGNMRVDSSPGMGAAFIFELPL
jgi:PAS domain S-box-containing protein